MTRDEERVLRGGGTVMKLCRYEGSVVVRTAHSLTVRTLYGCWLLCTHSRLYQYKVELLTLLLHSNVTSEPCITAAF